MRLLEAHDAVDMAHAPLLDMRNAITEALGAPAHHRPRLTDEPRCLARMLVADQITWEGERGVRGEHDCGSGIDIKSP